MIVPDEGDLGDPEWVLELPTVALVVAAVEPREWLVLRLKLLFDLIVGLGGKGTILGLGGSGCGVCVRLSGGPGRCELGPDDERARSDSDSFLWEPGGIDF